MSCRDTSMATRSMIAIVLLLATLARAKPLDIDVAMLVGAAYINATSGPSDPPAHAGGMMVITTVSSRPTTAAAVPEISLTPTATLPGNAVTASTTASSNNATNTPDNYAQAILDQHNQHRANSSALELAWSPNMANIAAQIAASCVYAHDTSTGGGGYGQNIGAGAEPSAVPALITNEMYNSEIGFYPTPYGNNNPDMSEFEKWGHYSQIVWRSTTSVGCATQYCPGGLANTGDTVSPYFTVCNYSPPGNFAGQYSNVGAPDSNLPSVFMQ